MLPFTRNYLTPRVKVEINLMNNPPQQHAQRHLQWLVLVLALFQKCQMSSYVVKESSRQSMGAADCYMFFSVLLISDCGDVEPTNERNYQIAIIV